MTLPPFQFRPRFTRTPQSFATPRDAALPLFWHVHCIALHTTALEPAMRRATPSILDAAAPCCAHDCGADLLLRAESLLLRLALRARAQGAWRAPRAKAPAQAWCAELTRPWTGWLTLRCGADLERLLAGGHAEGLLDLLLRRLSGDCVAAGGEAWDWRAMPAAEAPAGRSVLLKIGSAPLQLWHWT